MSDCKKLTECVACSSNKLKLVLDLKKQPLANSYKLKKDDWQPEFPLAINLCEECYHVQLTHLAGPTLVFEDNFCVSDVTQAEHEHFNRFEQIADPLEFLLKVKSMMNDDSLFFVQTPQANMILNNEFDIINHEHISFFNSQSMKKLCDRADLYLVSVNKVPIDGGSYIFTISKKERKGNVDFVIAQEESWGLYQTENYVKYANRCEQIIDELVMTVCQFTKSDVGWSSVGYGATTKGMTLLNYSGLKLDFIIDDDPLKQGRFTPGSSIPIVSSDELTNHTDSLVFVPLTWNLYGESVRKIKKLREDNPNSLYDRYITYFPSVVTSS